MQALILGQGASQSLRRIPLASADGHDEKWLQALLFQHPDLIPIEQIDPGAGRVVPICRELAIPKDGSTVFLDMLGVTAQGRLVLVECKLWRNPQARREVIAQILEYAALLRQWSYADLTAKLIQAMRWSGPNPLYAEVQRQIPEMDEVRFVESVSRSLFAGDFDLVVAGDGIRSDLQAIAGHLNGHAGFLARLALVEFQIWTGSAGQTLVIPWIPMRTQVIEHRVVVDPHGVPLALVVEDKADASVETLVNSDQAANRDRDRVFWQRFIDTVRFDHPDQPPPRHGGRNWIKIDLPSPARWLTAYRSSGDRAGLFLSLADEAGAAAFAELSAEANQLREEIGLDLLFEEKQALPFRGDVLALRTTAGQEGSSDDELLAWFVSAANRMVNALRPRLAAMDRRAMV
jgi:hypothetical protein